MASLGLWSRSWLTVARLCPSGWPRPELMPRLGEKRNIGVEVMQMMQMLLLMVTTMRTGDNVCLLRIQLQNYFCLYD